MHTVIFDRPGKFHIPSWITDLASFRKWYHSDEFPEEGRIWFSHDGVWVDMCREQLFSHNQVKSEITAVVAGFVKHSKIGRFFCDGARITNQPAEISGVPDGSYVSFDSFRDGRLKDVEDEDGGCTELEGTPDLVIEVVSPSSEEKDTVWLRQSYWVAGIPEYWLIDARTPPSKFDIFCHSQRGYTSVRKSSGWIKSAVLGKSFRLSEEINGMGHPDYTLELR